MAISKKAHEILNRPDLIERRDMWFKRMRNVYDSTYDEWGKKKLAYEVQKMTEGFYYFIQFDAETDAPREIENRVRIMENVMRFLVVKQDA